MSDPNSAPQYPTPSSESTSPNPASPQNETRQGDQFGQPGSPYGTPYEGRPDGPAFGNEQGGQSYPSQFQRQPDHGQPYGQPQAGQPQSYGYEQYVQPEQSAGQYAYGAYGQEGQPYVQPAQATQPTQSVQPTQSAQPDQSSQPAQPSYGPSDQTPYAQNGPSAYGQPIQPTYSQPIQPAYTQTPQTAYGQTTQSPYGQPAQPAYGQTAQTAYGQTTQPPYSQPTQPEYGQPEYAQPEYRQPVQPAYAPYGQSQASGQASGQPGDAYGDPYGNPYAYAAQPQPGAPAGAPNGTPAAAYAGSTGAHPLDKPYYGCPPQEAFLRFFRKYVTFSGRASRSEYWWWALISILVVAVLRYLANITDDKLEVLITVWSLGTLVPGLALSVRRLHDTGRSGGWIALPMALEAVGVVMMLIGTAGSMFGAAAALHSGSGLRGALMSILILIIGGLLILAGGIVNIVFMAARSRSEGVRFDHDSTQQYGGTPVNTYGQPYGQGNPSNQFRD